MIGPYRVFSGATASRSRSCDPGTLAKFMPGQSQVSPMLTAKRIRGCPNRRANVILLAGGLRLPGTKVVKRRVVLMTRLLIADDHEVVRAGLRQILQSHPGW